MSVDTLSKYILRPQENNMFIEDILQTQWKFMFWSQLQIRQYPERERETRGNSVTHQAMHANF
jgi:hypothetical protein